MIEERDWRVIEKLQEGIPLCERPFAEMAEGIGLTEGKFMGRVRALLEAGAIRRLGPRLRHHRVGARGTVMVVWRVPEERLDEVGEVFAASPAVSHCYVRPTFEDFPYNLYTVVHAPDTPAAERLVAGLSAESGVNEYRMMHTVRELKKSTPVYRRPESDGHDDR